MHRSVSNDAVKTTTNKVNTWSFPEKLSGILIRAVFFKYTIPYIRKTWCRQNIEQTHQICNSFQTPSMQDFHR